LNYVSARDEQTDRRADRRGAILNAASFGVGRVIKFNNFVCQTSLTRSSTICRSVSQRSGPYISVILSLFQACRPSKKDKPHTTFLSFSIYLRALYFLMHTVIDYFCSIVRASYCKCVLKPNFKIGLHPAAVN